MKYATVLRFNRNRGFGFAAPDDETGTDIFIHVSQLPSHRKVLREGDRISYEIGQFKDKTVAVNIRLIEAAPAPEVRP